MTDFSMKDYLDSKFDYLDNKLDSLDLRITDVKSNQDHTSNSVRSLVDKVNDVNVTLTRLTDTVEVHEKRSTTLEKEFRPVRDAYNKSKVITEYRENIRLIKESKRKILMDKWKYPVSIFVGLCSTAAFGAWVVHIFDYIKNIFKY